MSDAPKSFTTQFSRIGVFLLLVFSITLLVVSVANAIHYDSILTLSNGDDSQIGVRRGSLIWFYWLNVILAIVSSFATIYFFYRLFFKSNINESKAATYLSNKLGAESVGVDRYLLEKNCKELGIEGNSFEGDCQEYGTLNDDKKVDFYLEKSFNIEDKLIKYGVKKNFCPDINGSKCNKRINNLRDEVKYYNDDKLTNINNDYKKAKSDLLNIDIEPPVVVDRYQHNADKYQRNAKECNDKYTKIKDAGFKQLKDGNITVNDYVNNAEKVTDNFKNNDICGAIVCKNPLVTDKPGYCV
jgi:hypothetical protein